MKLILYIVYNNKTIEYPLPAITDRRHLIYLPDIDNECCISVEFFDNVWTVNESENISLFADRHNVSSFILESGKILNIKYKDLHEISLIVQEITENEMTFIKYDISAVGKIRIGQDDVCEITLNNPFISKHHAIIGMVNGEYFISDQSTNGTYINGERIKGKTPLKIFDSIYTVGLKVVFLGNILAVSKTPGIKVNLPEADISEKIMREKKDNGGVIVFSTSPRRIEQLEPADISIDLPPAKNNQREQPLIFMLGPSLTMPIPMFVSVMMNMALTGSSSIERLIMSLSSIIASSGIGLGWALARRQYAKKVKAEDEKIRTEAYKKYLDKTSEFLMDKHIINRNTLNLMYPPTNELIGIIEHDNSKLWNHSPRQKDFLTLRLGKGFVDYPGNIKLPAERFSVRNDELAEKPYEIYESFRYIKDAVSLIELKKHKIVGVIGNNRDVGSIASNLLIQIAAAYSYLDVKTAIFYDDSYRETFAWAKWLPHTFSPDKKIRMIARDRASSQGILYYLSTELRKRSEDEKKAVMLPYYVVFCTSPSFFEDEVIEKYINSENQLGICFILLYGESVLLPNTCKYVIRCDTEFKGRYALDERRTLVNSTDFDSFNISEADTFARKISGMYIKELSTGEIPSSVEYLDMIGIGNVEQWDLLRHYKENRVYEHIRSFIGITVGNKPMYLDIHEKKYGPHGLVAGTTGSGKSETIQTFIISLAMNYHPNEVAFILIDYKGGGMANAFIGMPHLAGTITNLSDMNDDNGETAKDESVDSSQTRRALISIKSEIKRRQAIFNQYKVNHIDLYIRLFREGKAQEPLPHLIIISDEFAELKKEQPEFIKELVSTARVGRSLGIHLILATQKPAGVVDDEIWSNSRFKICLRVQDRQDSNGMLKRPDAAYITQTGRAYLQIGNDEIFEMFQSGYSGAEYEPKKEAAKTSSGNTEMIELDGSKSVCRSTKKIRKTDSLTQLEACAQYISKVCRENGIKWTRPLWLPQLSSHIYYNDIISEYSESTSNKIISVFGMVDNPEKQSQFIASIDLTDCGNLLISGLGGSGKSVLIQTMLYDITKRYTSEQVNYYIFDFSGHILKVFKKAPHCGGVVFSDDEESVKRTLNLLYNKITARKKLFNEANVGSYTEYCNVETLPLILLVIDNYFAFNENYESLIPELSKVLREGPGCGIQVILSVSHQNDIKFRQRQNIISSIALRLSDRAEYSEALGAKPDFIPAACKGRGMMHSSGTLLEFQTALACSASSEYERSGMLTDEIEIIGKENKCKRADAIPVIPKFETYENFLEKYSAEAVIPIGYDMDKIVPISIDMKKSYCFSIYSYNIKNISLPLDSIFTLGRRINAKMFYCSYRNSEVKVNSAGAVRCRDYQSVYDMLFELKKNFKERSQTRFNMVQADPDADTIDYFIKETQPIFVVIDDFMKFLDVIYDESNAENMYSITESFIKQGAGHNVYFFAGFDSSATSGNFYKQSCKLFASYKTGMAVGGRLDSQNLFDIQLPLSSKMKSTNPNIGYFFHNNISKRIYLPTTESYEEQ